jgi:hypothetical protein
MEKKRYYTGNSRKRIKLCFKDHGPAIQGHSFARDTVKKLQEANNSFIEGEKDSVMIYVNP